MEKKGIFILILPSDHPLRGGSHPDLSPHLPAKQNPHRHRTHPRGQQVSRARAAIY